MDQAIDEEEAETNRGHSLYHLPPTLYRGVFDVEAFKREGRRAAMFREREGSRRGEGSSASVCSRIEHLARSDACFTVQSTRQAALLGEWTDTLAGASRLCRV